VPLLVSDFGADLAPDPPPLAEGFVTAGGVLVLELVGALTTGVVMTGALTADGATVTDVEEPLLCTPPTVSAGLAARAGALGGLTASRPIAGALLSAIGIAAPAAAAGRLGGSRSAGALAGRSARPSIRQAMNTSTHNAAEAATARA
jgi:hypothetical protein